MNRSDGVKTSRIVVEAGGLEFVTTDGRVLARLEEARAGGGVLSLLDAQGQLCAQIGSGADGGVVCVRAQKGKGRATMFIQEHEGVQTGAVSAFHDGGKEAARMGTSDYGGGFSCYSPEGYVSLVLCTGVDGGILEMCRSDGAAAVRTGAYGKEGALVVFNAETAPAFAVPVWKLMPAADKEKTDEQSKIDENTAAPAETEATG